LWAGADMSRKNRIIISKCLCVYLVLLKHRTLTFQVSYSPIFDTLFISLHITC
jgi:hypothetical protein